MLLNSKVGFKQCSKPCLKQKSSCLFQYNHFPPVINFSWWQTKSKQQRWKGKGKSWRLFYAFSLSLPYLWSQVKRLIFLNRLGLKLFWFISKIQLYSYIIISSSMWRWSSPKCSNFMDATTRSEPRWRCTNNIWKQLCCR